LKFPCFPKHVCRFGQIERLRRVTAFEPLDRYRIQRLAIHEARVKVQISPTTCTGSEHGSASASGIDKIDESKCRPYLSSCR
jgi:hypothetical protein